MSKDKNLQFCMDELKSMQKRDGLEPEQKGALERAESALKRLWRKPNPSRREIFNTVRKVTEAIINAFTQPLLERSARGGAGWKSYFALVAYVNNSPEFGPVMMTQHFDPLVERFIAVMREALPRCPAREIYWGYQFLTGALTLTFAETGRIDQLSGGLCRASDLDSVHERLAPYVAAGFRALCARSQPPPRPGKRAERRAAPRR
jgi:hypothetical protein